jgi:hypothetical protein
MQAVVGVVRTYSEALRIVEAVRQSGVPDRHISVLSPHTPEGDLQHLPKTDAEQPGIGGAIGGVVGGATGTASGMAIASLALPGVGPIVAAGAIALGLLGAVAGTAVGSGLDHTLSKGLPTDELYVYRDALRRGRSVVVVSVDDDGETERVRQRLADLGAESIDAAREEWWIGLRDAEETRYVREGGDFRKDEALFRRGFDAAVRLRFEPPPFEDARATLLELHGAAADERPFRVGYERGRAWRSADDAWPQPPA